MEVIQKLLAISIPTWNRATLLNDLLENLTVQILKFKLENNIEIIISNNASTDNTELICGNYLRQFDFITYNKNLTNIGARSNVLKSIELSTSKYVIFLGDDDRLSDDALQKLIDFLLTHPETGLLLDISRSKLKNLETQTVVTLSYLLENYYWYIGNAGLFIVKSSYFKKSLKKHNYEYFNSSWPQTQIIILGLTNNNEDRIILKNLDLVSDAVHDQVMIYSSLYIWRTCHLDLYNSINKIKSEIDKSSYKTSLNYLRKNIKQIFFNILQCGIFIDDYKMRIKTAKDILINIYKFSLKEILFLSSIIILLIIPTIITKPLSNLFIFIIRGSEGLEKKSAFVMNEINKKKVLLSNKNSIVRQFEFDTSKSS